MKCVLKLICLIGILPLISARHVQFYRKDYTYIEEYDAFYKLHWDLYGHSWNSAFLACDDEGATLFYPKVKSEWSLVKNLTNYLTDAPNVTDIFVGLHDEFGVGEFVTVDGHSTSSPLLVEEPDRSSDFQGGNCVMMNIDTGVYRVGPCLRLPFSPLPFVCKKVESESCPTIDKDYKYIKSSRKCYKVNKRPKMWDEAMRTCYMEGGILTVIQNKEEANTIWDLLEADQNYFVGIRRTVIGGEYYTVRGQQLDSAYQNPYNDNDNGNNDCGGVYKTYNNGRTLYTQNSDCGTRLPFICEIEVSENK